MCKCPEVGMNSAHTGGKVRRRVCLAQDEPGEEWWEVNGGGVLGGSKEDLIVH